VRWRDGTARRPPSLVISMIQRIASARGHDRVAGALAHPKRS
jgi:hypothetical protein